MTETRIGQYTPFAPHPGHRQMTPDDAAVFLTAADMIVWPEVSTAIRSAGGDLANIYYFNREVCGGRPAVPWAEAQDHETVVAELRRVGEGLTK